MYEDRGSSAEMTDKPRVLVLVDRIGNQAQELVGEMDGLRTRLAWVSKTTPAPTGAPIIAEKADGSSEMWFKLTEISNLLGRLRQEISDMKRSLEI